MSKGISVVLEYHRLSANSKRVLGEMSTTSFILATSATSAHRANNAKTAGSEERAEEGSATMPRQSYEAHRAAKLGVGTRRPSVVE